MPATARLNELARDVLALKSFEPSAHVNALFAELVHAVLISDCNPSSPIVTFAPEELRDACAMAEAALEFHWAARLAAGASLSSFPYTTNYELLGVWN